MTNGELFTDVPRQWRDEITGILFWGVHCTCEYGCDECQGTLIVPTDCPIPLLSWWKVSAHQ